MTSPVSGSSDPLGTCLQALEALYTSADDTTRRQADAWLIHFQADRGFWHVANALLHRPQLNEHAYFFAANGLLAKIQYSCSELQSAEERAGFRDSLLKIAGQFAQTGSPPVRLKLAMCVAALAVHLMGMDEWPNAIPSLVHQFGPTSQLMLLDILTFLPEENHNTRLLLHSTTRVKAQRLMLESTAQIVQLLMEFLGSGAVALTHISGPQKSLYEKILATFLAWVKASGQNRQFTPPPGMGPAPKTTLLSSENLVNHPLLLFCFKIIASKCDELEQIAIDVLCSLLHNFNLVTRSVRGGQRGFRSATQQFEEEQYDGDGDGDFEEGQWGSGSFSPAAQQQQQESQYEHIYFMRFMIARTLELVPLFDALPPPTPGSEDEQDDHFQLARSYGRLFGDLGEFYLHFIVEFCLGVEGFSETHDPTALQNLRTTMVVHAGIEAAAKNQPPVQLTNASLEELIKSNQDLASQIVGVILKCATSPRREVNLSVLYFWFLLSEALNSTEWSGGGGRNNKLAAPASQPGVLSPLQIRAKKKLVFQPAFQALVPQLHRLIVLPAAWAPPGAPQQLSGEASEEVKKAREQAGATLVDVETILGHEAILELLTSDGVMGAQLAAYQADRTRWRELEATLFCIWRLGGKVCGSVDEARQYVSSEVAFAQGGKTNSQLLPKIFGLLFSDAWPANLPVPQTGGRDAARDGHQTLKYITLRILARYALWIKEHDRAAAASNSAANFLGPALRCIVGGLQDGVCKAAAFALCEVCEHNRERIANGPQNFIGALMEVYSSACTIPVTNNSVANARGMTLNDQRFIIEGVAAVVSCVHPQTPAAGAQPVAPAANLLPHYLHQLVLPMVTEMQKIVTAAQQAATPQLPADVSTALTNHLERLAETMAKLSPSLNPNRPYFIASLLDLYQKVLAPLLYSIMSNFCDDERRMDKLCRVVKHVIKTTKLEFLPQCLEPLLHNLFAAFNRHPHACFLYLLGVHCVDCFGMHPKFQPILLQLLPGFMAKCIEAIPDGKAMIHDPNMTEDFFMTCNKVIEKCPDIFFGLQILPQIINRTILGLSLQHKDSFSSVCHFLAGFLWQGINSPDANQRRMGQPVVQEQVLAIQRCLAACGPALCDGLIQSVSGAIPMQHVRMLSGVFEALLLFANEACRPWFIEALHKIPATADPTKEEFLGSLFSFRASYLRNALDRFGEACRIKKEVAN